MQWLIIAGVLVLLLRAKKLPDMARSASLSARVVKGEMSLRDNEKLNATTVADRPTAVRTLIAASAHATDEPSRTNTGTTSADTSR